MMKTLTGERGLTLIEVVIVMAVAGIILPVILGVFYLLVWMPAQRDNILTALNDVRTAAQQIVDDGNKAQSFAPACAPDYGTLSWTDYSSSPVTQEIRYYYAQGNLYREHKAGGTVVSSTAIARHIADYRDVRFEVEGRWVKVHLKSTVGTVSRETTVYFQPRSQPGGKAGPVLGRNWVILAGEVSDQPSKVIEWSGNGSKVEGDIHSNSDIFLSGSSNQFSGVGEARLSFWGGGSDNTFGEKYEGAPVISLPPPCSLSEYLQPYTFSWSGNVKLKDAPEVWEDYPARTRLKPGVYHSGGKLQLSRSGVSGRVTFVAPDIVISGDNLKLTPYAIGVLLYSSGTGDSGITISGDESNFSGELYALGGRIDISGDDISLKGKIIAQRVKVSGSFRTLTPAE
jgi:prepilin-type N-terminal cleavage/methylation domain-containing protein